MNIVGIHISSDILHDEHQRDYYVKRLKAKLSIQVGAFEVILDKIQQEIEDLIRINSKGAIVEYGLKKDLLKKAYYQTRKVVNTNIEQLKDISRDRYAEPLKEVKQTARLLIEAFNDLRHISLEGYQFYNDVTLYKYSNALLETKDGQQGSSHALVMQMIDEHFSSMISTMMSQIKDLEDGMSYFSKLLDSIQDTINSSIQPRMDLLEHKQHQNIQEIFQVRKELEKELHRTLEKINLGHSNPELNEKFEAFKTDMEEKLNEINNRALGKLQEYVNAELASTIDSLKTQQTFSANDLLQMQRQIMEQSKQIELGQRELNELDTKFSDKLTSLKQDMDNKIARASEAVIQKLKDIVKNEIVSRIDSLENQQSQNVLEILEMRKDIIKQSTQIKLAKDELRDFDKKFETEFVALQENVENQILQMHNSIVAKLAEHYSQEEQYTEINEQIAQKINAKCSPEVIHSLALGRYLAKYQKEILNGDASVVFLAYAKAVEKILIQAIIRTLHFIKQYKMEK